MDINIGWLLTFFLAVAPHCQCIFPESEGFSLKLIRRDYSNVHFPDTIQPKITRSRYLYTIDASIGTPSRKRTFIFDPGSSLTWTQCTPSRRSFKQDYPLFDPKKSSSYKKLSPNHSLARFFRCSNNGDCIYNITYGSGELSSGIGSVETFTFPSNKNAPESLREIVFGCGNSFQGQLTSNTAVTGIMGMNRSPLSLIGQIGPRSVRRFSYCLPRLNSPVATTFLRFGNDVKQKGGFQKTGFLGGARSDYSVRLLNLSIAGRLLNVPTGSFSGGCILDVGSGASSMETGAFDLVLMALRQHFGRFNLMQVGGDPRTDGELCYHLKSGFRSYPTMILHFQGADLEIGPETLFRFVSNRFCVAIFRAQRSTVLGAYQQQNVRFVYDVGNENLLFSKDDCSQDRA